MGELKTIHEHRSIHEDYLRFAWLSVRDCKKSKLDPTETVYVNRPAIEAIRYSYDCLDASTNFVFHQGKINQLPISIKDNWLSRYVFRKWPELSLSDRLGILSFAWTRKCIWQTKDQFQLFEDLKKVRNGLTHPIVFGSEINYEVLTEEEKRPGTICEIRRQIGEDRLLKPDWLLDPNKAVASFSPRADKLGKEDAEQAFEILLHHLRIIESLFFKGLNKFGVYDNKNKQILYLKQLIDTITCRFTHIWETDLGGQKEIP